MNFESFHEGITFFLWATLCLSVIFGAIVNKTNFCTMGAVSDMVNIGDYSRLRAWFLAIAVAILGVASLEYLQLVDVTAAFPPYRDSQLILGENIIGGFLFGVGMTLASGCGNKTLVRIGGGNIKSIIVFAIIAIIAYYMTNPFPGSDKTLFSLFFYDWIRPLSLQLSSNQDLGAMLSTENTSMTRLITGCVISVALLIVIFKASDFRASKVNIASGLSVGLIIVAGWYLSNNIQITKEETPYTLSSYYQEWDMIAAEDEVKPAQGRTLSPQSFTFINPIGQTYGYVEAGFDKRLLTFGLISVFGVILGSFLFSIFSRSFRIEWFNDVRDFVSHLIGAVLMGFGGTLALGCTIGQGITGVSTLALGSFAALVAIIFGSALTMKVQYYRMVYEDDATFIKALLSSLVDMKLLPAALRRLDAV